MHKNTAIIKTYKHHIEESITKGVDVFKNVFKQLYLL